MTLRFRRATKLRAMARGIEHSKELTDDEQIRAINALELVIRTLDPPHCVAPLRGTICGRHAPPGSLHCNLHRKAEP